MKLTLTRIAALKCPPGKKDRLVFDDDQRGLGVRVTSSGGKTFLAQYTASGRKHRIPLGSCDALSLAKAREAVRSIMGDLAKGIDPADARRRKADGNVFTVAALLLDWHADTPTGRQARTASPCFRVFQTMRADAREMNDKLPSGIEKFTPKILIDAILAGAEAHLSGKLTAMDASDAVHEMDRLKALDREHPGNLWAFIAESSD